VISTHVQVTLTNESQSSEYVRCSRKKHEKQKSKQQNQ